MSDLLVDQENESPNAPFAQESSAAMSRLETTSIAVQLPPHQTNTRCHLKPGIERLQRLDEVRDPIETGSW